MPRLECADLAQAVIEGNASEARRLAQASAGSGMDPLQAVEEGSAQGIRRAPGEVVEMAALRARQEVAALVALKKLPLDAREPLDGRGAGEQDFPPREGRRALLRERDSARTALRHALRERTNLAAARQLLETSR
jgi:hypothetical protein